MAAALTVPTADLTGNTIASTYDQLLILDSTAGMVNTTLKIVATQTGHSALRITNDQVLIKDASTVDIASVFEVQDKDANVILSVDGLNNKVGIGTASPNKQLEIESASGNCELHIDAADDAYLLLDAADDDNASRVIFQKAGSTRGSVTYEHDGTAADEKLQFKVDGTVKMSIAGDGDIGIGTVASDTLLFVAGGFKCGSTSSTTTFTDHAVILCDSGTSHEGGLLFTQQDSSAGSKSSAKMTATSCNGSGTADFFISVIDNEAPNTIIRTWIACDGATGSINLSRDGGNVGIDTTAFASGVRCLGLQNGTAPGGAASNTAGLYTSGGDLYGFADDGNATALAAASSDERIKDNIAVIPNALSRLVNVKGVTFNYVSFKDSALPFKDKIPDSQEYAPYKNWGDDIRVGVIAQDVEVAYDGLNITNSVRNKAITGEEDNPEVYGISKQVDMETLIPLLIEAVKELSAKVTVLENA